MLPNEAKVGVDEGFSILSKFGKGTQWAGRVDVGTIVILFSLEVGKGGVSFFSWEFTMEESIPIAMIAVSMIPKTISFLWNMFFPSLISIVRYCISGI